MNIDQLHPNQQILAELGHRLARMRKQRGFSQVRLAEQAGIGIATLKRIEAGHDSQMESWLKLLKALDLVSALDAFLPESFSSPMQEVLESKKGRPKRRATTEGVVWGDQTE